MLRSVPRPISSSGGHKGQLSRDCLPAFFFVFAGGPREQPWHGQAGPLLDVTHPAHPLQTAASRTLQGAVRDDFRRGCHGV